MYPAQGPTNTDAFWGTLEDSINDILIDEQLPIPIGSLVLLYTRVFDYCTKTTSCQSYPSCRTGEHHTAKAYTRAHAVLEDRIMELYNYLERYIRLHVQRCHDVRGMLFISSIVSSEWLIEQTHRHGRS